jgi:hypothetical protein
MIMNKAIFFINLFLLVQSIVCQTIQLKPSIGISSVPSLNDAICNIPIYTGNYTVSGYQAGDTIPHFKLFDKNGTAYDVLQALQTGKPLLLIGGSYTCPLFRQKISVINQVNNLYGNLLTIWVIYVVEAHPKAPDVSPYSGTLWTTAANNNEGILYLQPTTYGARINILNDMLANPLYTLSVPVLIDAPCNQWWLNFGPAPNNAYLIYPNGVIYKKHPWFDKQQEGDTIMKDIQNLLNILSINKKENASHNSLFIYPNPVENGVAYIHSDITNLEEKEYDVLDITGRSVKNNVTLLNQGKVLNVEHLPSGVYFFKFVTLPEKSFRFLKK